MKLGNYRTKTLFHYTKRMYNILEIIKSGMLYPNYCKEDLSTIRHPNRIVGIPQICFCDIPLSLANTLVKNYGSYAIGFKKQWGISKGCNPIQYVNNEEVLNGLVFYHEMWKEYQDSLHDSASSFGEKASLFFKQFDSHDAKVYLFGFMKRYMGKWQGKDYCNYEENEWRYIIKEGLHDIRWLWGKTEYEKWRGDSRNAKPVPTEDLKSLGLRFGLDDINHIVLSNDCMVPKFIAKLENVKSQKGWNDETFFTLLSKITTFDRIKKDY